MACGEDTYRVFRVGGMPGVWGLGGPSSQSSDACIAIQQGFGLATVPCDTPLRHFCRLR